MSRTEHHTGKAKKIEFKEETSLQEKIDILKERGFGFDSDDVENNDISADNENLMFLYSSKEFYELIDHKEQEDEQDISTASRNEDGSINFTLQFYNGGCCLEEAFEDAISKLEDAKAPGIREKLNEILEPIIERGVELIERGNEDEMVGFVVKLSKQVQNTEDSLKMVELALLPLLQEIITEGKQHEKI